MVLGVDGIADFNALHSRKHDDEVQLYAFDASRSTVKTCEPAAIDAQDQLARLLARRPVGVFRAFEQGDDRSRPVRARLPTSD